MRVEAPGGGLACEFGDHDDPPEAFVRMCGIAVQAIAPTTAGRAGR
ncbi:hypothetical protein ACFV84_16940 [Kitasatospora sp. NPDC059811]|nr:hypothetical protein [Streptomyces sp. MJM8645]